MAGQRKRNTRKGEETFEKGGTQKGGTGNRERRGRYCNKRNMNWRFGENWDIRF